MAAHEVDTAPVQAVSDYPNKSKLHTEEERG